MPKTTKFLGLCALSIAVLCLWGCGESTPDSLTETPTTEAKQPDSPLVTEIRKLLRKQPHDEERLISAIDGMTEEEIDETFDRELKVYEEQLSEPLRRRDMLIAKMKLRGSFNRAGIHAAEQRRKAALEGIENTLQEMAEEEGLEPK